MKKIYSFFANISFVKKLMKHPFFEKVLSYEMLSYLFFGVMTTLVNFVVFFLSDKILGTKHLFDFTVFSHIFSITLEDVSTIIAWIASVVFAYITNKLWVFESKSWNARVVVREVISFFAARIVSFVVFESLGFMLLRNILLSFASFGETGAKWTAKIFMAVFTVVFNYVLSKLVIFKKGKDKDVK